jgi:23S rRNA pseudouridine1911/1915/1917 synthase
MALLHEAIARPVPWAASRSLGYLTNVHRPDADTSGALLLARERSALVALANQFNLEPPVTTCLALAQGTPTADVWEVEARLAPHPTRPGCLRVDPKHGKKARTRFAVVERFAGFALLRCEPFINRRHQIRLHLRHCGLCLVGDALYGGRSLLFSRLKPGYRFKSDREERPLLGRAALHLERLTVRHPATGGEVVIASPTPKDFLVALKFLRRYAPGGAPSPDGPEPG